jgi:hypothetical protein
MLPSVSARPAALSRIIALTAALALALPAAPALAWGNREQDALKGLAAALLVGALVKSYTDTTRSAQPVTRPTPQPLPVVQPVSIYQTASAQAFNRYSAPERRRIQTRLAGYGYYTGRIDGAYGPGTHAALAAYARSAGQSPSLATTAGAFAVMDGLVF